MKTVYVKEASVGKRLRDMGAVITEHYPNPIVKGIEAGGQKMRLHIITPGVTVVFKEMTEGDARWHTRHGRAHFGEGVVMVSCDWFPKDLLVGVEGQEYSEDTELSKRTGWVPSLNTGTNCAVFRASGIPEVKRILVANGFDNHIEKGRAG